jgi:hypothetical protein
MESTVNACQPIQTWTSWLPHKMQETKLQLQYQSSVAAFGGLVINTLA